MRWITSPPYETALPYDRHAASQPRALRGHPGYGRASHRARPDRARATLERHERRGSRRDPTGATDVRQRIDSVGASSAERPATASAASHAPRSSALLQAVHSLRTPVGVTSGRAASWSGERTVPAGRVRHRTAGLYRRWRSGGFAREQRADGHLSTHISTCGTDRLQTYRSPRSVGRGRATSPRPRMATVAGGSGRATARSSSSSRSSAFR
jgi:hypothetical protein